MKKVALCLLVTSVVAFAGRMVLLEAYQNGELRPDDSQLIDTALLVLEFSIDSSCYAVFSTGGYHRIANMWLELDGESLPHTTRATTALETEHPLDQTYMCVLSAGFHTMEFRWRNMNPASYVKNGRLQALLFLPDTATAIAEQPVNDAEPNVNTPSLVSKGPYVSVSGATELVDATGRVIEGAIEEDKVFISNLPTGTYFARDEDRTIVKIVKVQ